MFTFSYAKKFLVLGVILFVTGLVSIVLLFSPPQVETAYQTSVDITTKGWYNSDKFRAEDRYWLDLDISSTGPSALHIVGQTVGEVFKVEGSVYEYSVKILTMAVYQVQVENKAGHYELIYIWTLDENHIIGNFKLRRTPTHSHQLLSVDAIMLALGLVMIPSVIYMEHRARQKAKLECEYLHARALKKPINKSRGNRQMSLVSRLLLLRLQRHARGGIK